MTKETDTGFGKLNLKAETHVVAPGRHLCTISDVRLIWNRDKDTLWLTITIEVHSEDGEVLGQVEERFLTVAAKPTSPHAGRVREGLKRLALYGNAIGVDLNDIDHDDILGKLVGHRIRAVIGRRGVGVQAENSISAVLKADA
ncbi:MAG: hypothetical protein WCJ41_19725 [Aestuariivirga sp.]|uniref:hypothetical protein n=1 Tax=Aestuariivirga sp. TaxID=2650926 RepID=UPI0030183BC8